MDLTSRLRAIVRPRRAEVPAGDGPVAPRRELTYEPDDERRPGTALNLEEVAGSLGGRLLTNRFGQCLAIDRRYEADRWHGDVQIGSCELSDLASLRVLDPGLQGTATREPEAGPAPRAIFLDLETTGLSGGAGTVAFLIGCGYFDLGAFQVRQFLLTGYSAERALLTAAAELLGSADLLVTYNGKTFDLPVMDTRWAFHRMPAPLGAVPHFDMLHPARRLWKGTAAESGEGGCRLTALERLLLNVRRVGDVDGFEIPGRFFQFLRTADPGPLEPVLEHNRLDLVSLAAVTSRALQLAHGGEPACRDGMEALALGRVLERAGAVERAEACYRRAVASARVETSAEACYRLGVRCRRDRRFDEAVAWWRELLARTEGAAPRGGGVSGGLRQAAIEALAIHHEHRARDLPAARELALFGLEAGHSPGGADSMRHRLARLDRKLGLFSGGAISSPRRAVSSPSARPVPPSGFRRSAPRTAS